MSTIEHIDTAKAERLLGALSQHLSPVPPPPHALNHLTKRAQEARRQVIWSWALVALCALTPVALALRGDFSAVASLAFLATAAAAGLTLWISTRQQATFQRLQTRQGDFFEDWRHDLQGRIRSTVAGVAFSGVFGICLLSIALLRPFIPMQKLLVICVGLLLLVGSLRAAFIELRDLRAERQLLGDSSHA